MHVAERFWSSTTGPFGWDAVERALLSPGGDVPLDVSHAFLAHHRLGERVLNAVADKPMLTGADIQAAAASADIDGISKADDAGLSERRIWEQLVRKGVPPQVAARRTGMVFGVPHSHLASWIELAARPGVREEAVIAKADTAVMERTRQVSGWVETDHPRDATGKFSTKSERKAKKEAKRAARVQRLTRHAAHAQATRQATSAPTATSARTITRSDTKTEARTFIDALIRTDSATSGRRRHGGSPPEVDYDSNEFKTTTTDPYHEQLERSEFIGTTATALRQDDGERLWAYWRGEQGAYVTQKWLNANTVYDGQAATPRNGMPMDWLGEKGYVLSWAMPPVDQVAGEAAMHLPYQEQEYVGSYSADDVRDLAGDQDMRFDVTAMRKIVQAHVDRMYPDERMEVAEGYADKSNKQLFTVVKLKQDVPNVVVMVTANAAGRTVSTGQAHAHAIRLGRNRKREPRHELELSDNGTFQRVSLGYQETVKDTAGLGLSKDDQEYLASRGIHAVNVVKLYAEHVDRQDVEKAVATLDRPQTMTWVETDHPRDAEGKFSTKSERKAKKEAKRQARVQRLTRHAAHAAATKTTAGTTVSAPTTTSARTKTSARTSTKARTSTQALTETKAKNTRTSWKTKTETEKKQAADEMTQILGDWGPRRGTYGDGEHESAPAIYSEKGVLSFMTMSDTRNPMWSMLADDVVGKGAVSLRKARQVFDSKSILDVETRNPGDVVSASHSAYNEISDWIEYVSEEDRADTWIMYEMESAAQKRNLDAMRVLFKTDAPDEVLLDILYDAGYEDAAAATWVRDIEQMVVDADRGELPAPEFNQVLHKGQLVIQTTVPWEYVPLHQKLVVWDDALVNAPDTTAVTVEQEWTTTGEMFGSPVDTKDGWFDAPLSLYRITPRKTQAKKSAARFLLVRLYDHDVRRSE